MKDAQYFLTLSILITSMKRGLEKYYSVPFMGDYAADERISMREALKTATNRKTEAFDIGILFKGSYDKIHFATVSADASNSNFFA